MRKIAVGLAILALSVGLAAQGEVKKEFVPLQGTWMVTTFNGNDVPPEAGASLVITGEKYQQVTNGVIDETGSLKLDTTKKPWAIDLIITTGADAGKTQLGIVEITGDVITFALAAPAATVRPTSLTSTDEQMLVTAKKQK